MSNLQKAKEYLEKGAYTCVITDGEHFLTSDKRGIKPLLEWYTQDIDVKGQSAADKVVGKAAAFMYVLLGVREVYAGVISRPSVEVLRAHKIAVTYGALVDAIRNRSGDGFCPMEQAVKDITEPSDAPQAIKNRLEELNR